METGISFEINEKLNIISLIGFSDLIWNIDNTGVFSYTENTVYTGLALEIMPIDFFTLNLGAFGNVLFEADALISGGFEQTTGLEFNIEEAFVEFNINNSISPTFNKNDASLTDTISYDLTFPFLNFINDKINTGLYIEGETEIENIFSDNSVNETNIASEFFAGIYTNPVEPLSIHILFAMFNEVSYDGNKALVEGTGVNAFGMKAGVNITHDWFWAEINYVPRFGVFIDDVNQNAEHNFEICFGVDF